MSILYTSGTTGDPKGVMLTHQNFAANVQSLLKVSPVRADETRICFLSLSHVFARTNDLYASVAGGCKLAVVESAQNMFRDLAEVRPTFFNGVPYLFEKCVAELQQRGTDHEDGALRKLLGGRIKAVNCGGAMIALEIEEYFWSHGIPMITGYGLTETSPVVTASSVSHHRRGTVGRPLPGVDVKIADDSEVLVAGENVTAGYYHDPTLTSQTIREGWFHTGDLGRIDEDGFLMLAGRKKEMILTSTGHNVFPQAIEKAIDSHPSVVRSCVTGDGLPSLVAIVELKTNLQAADHDQVAQQLMELTRDFATHEQPGKFIFAGEPFSVESGLLTEKGTLRRSELRKRYDELIQLHAGRKRVAKPDH